jgi:hypothetical protein
MLALCWTDSKDGRNRKQIKWVVQPDGLTPAQETRLSPDGHQDFGLLSVPYATNLGGGRWGRRAGVVAPSVLRAAM